MMSLPVYLTVTDISQHKTLTIEGNLELLWRILPSLSPDWGNDCPQDRARNIELQSINLPEAKVESTAT